MARPLGIEQFRCSGTLAAIPAPGLIGRINNLYDQHISTYNIFSAAALHTSSASFGHRAKHTGLPFDDPQPHYAPINEAHPLYPQSSYALSR